MQIYLVNDRVPHLSTVGVTIPLDILKRLVGAAAGIARDSEAVEIARAEIAHIETLLQQQAAA